MSDNTFVTIAIWSIVLITIIAVSWLSNSKSAVCIERHVGAHVAYFWVSTRDMERMDPAVRNEFLVTGDWWCR